VILFLDDDHVDDTYTSRLRNQYKKRRMALTFGNDADGVMDPFARHHDTVLTTSELKEDLGMRLKRGRLTIPSMRSSHFTKEEHDEILRRLNVAFLRGIPDAELHRVSVAELLDKFPALKDFEERPMHEALLALRAVTASNWPLHHGVLKAIRDWARLQGCPVNITPMNWDQHVSTKSGDEWTRLSQFGVFIEFVGRSHELLMYHINERKMTRFGWSRMFMSHGLITEFVTKFRNFDYKNGFVTLSEFVVAYTRFVEAQRWKWGDFADRLTPRQWTVLYKNAKILQEIDYLDDLTPMLPEDVFATGTDFRDWKRRRFLMRQHPDAAIGFNALMPPAPPILAVNPPPTPTPATDDDDDDDDDDDEEEVEVATETETEEPETFRGAGYDDVTKNRLRALMELEENELVPTVSHMHEFFQRVATSRVLLQAWTDVDVDKLVATSVFTMWFEAMVQMSREITFTTVTAFLAMDARLRGEGPNIAANPSAMEKLWNDIYIDATSFGVFHRLRDLCVDVGPLDPEDPNAFNPTNPQDVADKNRIKNALKRIERYIDSDEAVNELMSPVTKDTVKNDVEFATYFLQRYQSGLLRNRREFAETLSKIMRAAVGLSRAYLNRVQNDWDWRDYVLGVELSTVIQLDTMTLDDFVTVANASGKLTSYITFTAFLNRFMPLEFPRNVVLFAETTGDLTLLRHAQEFGLYLKNFRKTFEKWFESYKYIKRIVEHQDAHMDWENLEQRRAHGIEMAKNETVQTALDELDADLVTYFGDVYWAIQRPPACLSATQHENKSVFVVDTNGEIIRDFPGTELPVIIDCAVFLQLALNVPTLTGKYPSTLRSGLEHAVTLVRDRIQRIFSGDSKKWNPNAVRRRGIDEAASELGLLVSKTFRRTSNGGVVPEDETTVTDCFAVVCDDEGHVVWRMEHEIRETDILLRDAQHATISVATDSRNKTVDELVLLRNLMAWEKKLNDEVVRTHGNINNVDDKRDAAIVLTSAYEEEDVPVNPHGLPPPRTDIVVYELGPNAAAP